MATRVERIAANRAHVGEVALGLFLEHGYAATSVDDIAAAAGIGRATFFRYFPVKDAVLFEDIVAAQDRIVAEIAHRPAHEAPIVSALMACREPGVLDMDLRRFRRIRRIMSADPSLLDAQRLQLNHTFADRLELALTSRSPESSEVEIRFATQIAMAWTGWAMGQHLNDKRPVAEHLDKAVNATLHLAEQIAAAIALTAE